MLFTEEIISRRLNLIVQNDFDWLQLFDSREHSNELQIVLNDDNMDFFYPNWIIEYDPDNLPATLDEIVADRFNTINVTISEGVSFNDGEGEYKVTAFAIAFPVDEDKFGISSESIVYARLFYQVSPDLPDCCLQNSSSTSTQA